MGVLNVTPDSFSDGGLHFSTEAAIRRGIEIAEQGADLLDVGGESTRPGADAVPADEEWQRVEPALKGLVRKIDLPISIDTRKPEVAEKALQAGAAIVNDVTGLANPAMVRLVAKHGAGAVIMHMRGEPKTMQDEPRYDDVVREIHEFLAQRIQGAVRGGIGDDRIAVDPGIGFGKTADHNLTLLARLDAFSDLGRPIVIGVSRKGFIGRVGGGQPGERVAGSIAAATLAVARGAHLVRAHDVLETVRAMRVADAVLRGRENL